MSGFGGGKASAATLRNHHCDCITLCLSGGNCLYVDGVRVSIVHGTAAGRMPGLGVHSGHHCQDQLRESTSHALRA